MEEGVFFDPMWNPASSAVAGVGDKQISPFTQAGPEKLPEMNARRNKYSKQQWLELKPIIKQLYIDEGQTFSKVAEYLQEYHGFTPT